ncbi:CheR family methyltransferase [Rhodocyclus tenuis]|uniref:Chemotaxis protein methyltransferase n=1 Tax=Rhodocyclus tenuis TaxID=1066 RepID=A0A840G7E6_RHOTE|nr:protein-glutamate O-methyltransferase CheR [Rhodocyclus tenuis]MBB4246880.1 chemotaxis protein methyltransferase CheR [Rhodocyclus tenuis]
MEAAITDQEFTLFQRLIYKIAGISMADSKKSLVVGRLQRRLREYGHQSFTQYYRMLASGENPLELQTMVDLLTTNETYFFREPKHFDFLCARVLPEYRSASPFRVWSAASSTGEEAYTLAMLLAEHRASQPWEVFASDISTKVLASAQKGHYPLDRNEGIPPALLRKYCLKGVRAQAGSFLIAPELRRRVSFRQINLTQPIDPEIGMFNVIFLRNVMIYFDVETKRQVVGNLLPRLVSGGYFIIGHSETLNNVNSQLVTVQPTVYRKP